MHNLLLIFLTGLTTGGLTCLALQGGLLASTMTNLPKGHHHSVPILSFLSAKLISHTLLGFLLGILGASISLSPITRGWLQITIGIYLFGIAGNLLDLHPFFRHFVITPPKFIAKFIKNKSQIKSPSRSFSAGWAPAILGFITVLIPCATTQAMEILALGTSKPLYSAAIMFAFVLGTFPSFLIFGFLVDKGSHSFQKYFPTVAATAMFIMSIYSVNSGIAVMGSPYTLQNFYSVATSPSLRISARGGAEAISAQEGNVQEITITVTNSGYSPRNVTLKKGVATKLKLITKNVQSCSRAFTIPALNIEKLLPETGESIIEFTPTKTGPLAFSCSMGMYTGLFNVIN